MDMETKVYENEPLGPMNILPSQFYSVGGVKSSEWRLMFAVLGNAVESYLRYKNMDLPKARRLFQEDKEWFQSTDTTWLCSFENICMVLDLDAGAVREALFREDSPSTKPARYKRC